MTRRGSYPYINVIRRRGNKSSPPVALSLRLSACFPRLSVGLSVSLCLPLRPSFPAIRLYTITIRVDCTQPIACRAVATRESTWHQGQIHRPVENYRLRQNDDTLQGYIYYVVWQMYSSIEKLCNMPYAKVLCLRRYGT